MKHRFCGQIHRDGGIFFENSCRVGSPATYDGVQVFFTGYMADRLQLAATLGEEDLGGSKEHGSNESKLIAKAYRKWGPSLQAHVQGEYATFVFDIHTKSAVLTHDALGLVPMFYSISPEGLAFATHLIDLMDKANTQVLDREYLADLLAVGYVISERTPFPSIRRLLPGMTLHWSPTKIRHIRTWDLAHAPEVRCSDHREYEDRFRALLSAGVRSALDTDGAVWVSLSGGLDSSSVACVAAMERSDHLAAYSLVNPHHKDSDERPWMRAVVKHSRIPWHPIDIGTVLPFTQLPNEFIGEPTTTSIQGEHRRVTETLFRSHGVTVLLTGDGGDTILGAMAGTTPVHLADHLFAGKPLRALRAMEDWSRNCDTQRSWSYWMIRTVLRPAAQHVMGRRIRPDRPYPLPPWVEPSYALEMDLAGRDQNRVATRCRYPGRQDIWDTLWYAALSQAMIPSGYLSYEQRHPLLYRPLVEFMCGIPWEQKVHPKCDRYLQRRALKGVLPEMVRRRAYKTGGTWPFVEGLYRSPLWLDYLCDDPLIAGLGMTRADAWRASMKQAAVGQTYGDRFFLTGVAIEVWLKGLKSWQASALPLLLRSSPNIHAN